MRLAEHHESLGTGHVSICLSILLLLSKCVRPLGYRAMLDRLSSSKWPPRPHIRHKHHEEWLCSHSVPLNLGPEFCIPHQFAGLQWLKSLENFQKAAERENTELGIRSLSSTTNRKINFEAMVSPL